MTLFAGIEFVHFPRVRNSSERLATRSSLWPQESRARGKKRVGILDGHFDVD